MKILLLLLLSKLSASLTYQDCVNTANLFDDEDQWIRSLKLDPAETTEKVRQRLTPMYQSFGRSIVRPGFAVIFSVEDNVYENTRSKDVFSRYDLSQKEKITAALKQLEIQIPTSPDHYNLRCYLKNPLWLFVVIPKGKSVLASDHILIQNFLESRIEFHMGLRDYHNKLIENALIFETLPINLYLLKGESLSDVVYLDLDQAKFMGTTYVQSTNPAYNFLSNLKDNELHLKETNQLGCHQSYESEIYKDFITWVVHSVDTAKDISWREVNQKLQKTLELTREARRKLEGKRARSMERLVQNDSLPDKARTSSPLSKTRSSRSPTKNRKSPSPNRLRKSFPSLKSENASNDEMIALSSQSLAN